MPEDRKRFTSSGVNLAEMQKNHNRKPLLSKILPSEAVMIAEVSDDAAACGESLKRVNGHPPPPEGSGRLVSRAFENRTRELT